jgi:uncharacterized protein (TIGR02145 family)
MRNKIILMTIAILTIAMSLNAQVKGTFTDKRDGKTYKTITIGKQTWMAENLAFKTKNGCFVYNNDTSNEGKYGYLYDWEAAKAACPGGWHLPTKGEIEILINYLGGETVAGGKLKSTSGWNAPNTGATNETGFTALPGGYRLDNGSFGNSGIYGFLWSSTENGTSNAWVWVMYYNFSSADRNDSGKSIGYSVRCLKD